MTYVYLPLRTTFICIDSVSLQRIYTELLCENTKYAIEFTQLLLVYNCSCIHHKIIRLKRDK
jgi:hypothetical protein